jgi:hypothetical protein
MDDEATVIGITPDEENVGVGVGVGVGVKEPLRTSG